MGSTDVQHPGRASRNPLIDAFVLRVKEMVGWNYREGARGKGGAVDCIHLVICPCLEIGYVDETFQLPPYPPIGYPWLWEELMPTYFSRLAEDVEVQAGDIVVLIDDTVPAKPPRHCGVLVENDRGGLNIALALLDRRIIGEMLYGGFWQDRTWGIFRLRDENDTPRQTGLRFCAPLDS